MLSIPKAKERLSTYSHISRAGVKTINHQVVFLKTVPLSDDDDNVDTNQSGLQSSYLDTLITRDDFDDLVELITASYEENLMKVKEQFFSFREFTEPFNAFVKNIQVDIPPIDSFQIELRPAQLFSHNLYYFIKDHENNPDIDKEARALLAKFDLPAEMVNITFTAISPINFKQLTHTLTIVSLLLREAAKYIGFVPGRSIGTITALTE